MFSNLNEVPVLKNYFPLSVLLFLLRLPIVGRFILSLIKRTISVVEFSHDIPDMPLYYPLHEMDEDEKKHHEEMIKKSSTLSLSDLAIAQKDIVQKGSSEKFFRHKTICDYTDSYLKGTVNPTQVIENIIKEVDALKRQNPIFTLIKKDELLTQAAESSKRYAQGRPLGALDGVPIAIKDDIPLMGFPLTNGTSFIFEVVEEDSFPIANLRKQGVLIVGKTNMHELGLGLTGFNNAFGTVRNPYNYHYHTGGSSSGSAAAVAMGLVPFALGTDGGGSVRIPAAMCGVVGLQPTFKRIAIDSNEAPSVIHFGIIAASVSDVALAYLTMAGRTNDFRLQSWKQPQPHVHNLLEAPGLEGLRIGVFWDHLEEADDIVVSATRRAIKFFERKGATITSIEIPRLKEIHFAHAVTIMSEMSLNLDHYYPKHRSDLGQESQLTLELARSFDNKEFLASLKVRAYAMRKVEEIFRDVDVILSPATASLAPKLNTHSFSPNSGNSLTVLGNFTGIPGIVFPISYDDVTSLPISIQIQASHWREDLLLHIAREAEMLLPDGWLKPDVCLCAKMKI